MKDNAHMGIILRIVFVLLALQGRASWGANPPADPWEALPENAWTITPNDPKYSPYGLVLLEARVPFGFIRPVEHFYRFRVLNHHGRTVLSQVLEFPPWARRIRGRVILPGGQVQELKEGVDFKPKKVTIGKVEVTAGMLGVPAGVTSDCIVEWAWEQSWTAQSLFRLSWPFPVVHLTVVIARATTDSYTISLGNGVRTPITSEKDNVNFFFLEDLPAVEALPYCPVGMDGATYVHRFSRPAGLNKTNGNSVQGFWDAFAAETTKDLDNLYAACKPLERVPPAEPRKSRLAFQKLSSEILRDLPDDQQQKSCLILERLLRSIRNIDCLTYEERMDFEKEGFNYFFWSGTISYGMMAYEKRANSYHLNRMFRALLRSANIPFKILMTADSSNLIFSPEHRNPDQLTRILIGIPKDGSHTLWIDTDLRFGLPGMIRAENLGIIGLEIDTTTGTGKLIQITPSLVKHSDKENYSGVISIKNNNWSISSTLTWHGASAALRRAAILQAKDGNPSQIIEKDLFHDAPGEIIKINDIQGINKNSAPIVTRFSVTGELQEESRIQISPFPGLQLPISVPVSWPQERFSPIRIPKCFDIEAQVSLVLPDNISWRPQSNLEFNNHFGTVVWRAQQNGRDLRINLSAKLAQMSAPAARYQELREFCNALKDAFRRNLQLARDPAN